LSVFYENPAAIIKKHDLIITTYHHLAEITETIQQLKFPAGKVVGIDTRLVADTMLRIARFPKTRIGVVCTNQNTAHMLKHILFGYHPEWDIEALTVEDPEKVRVLAQNCDHLIVTHTSEEEVTQLTGRPADVVVNFQIDEQSVAFLTQRINQIRMEKMQPLHSDSPKNFI
jgi:GntR family transcriptional regulator